MTITAAQVKDLRERTGAGMMDAKNALVEADGDMEKAIEVLRQKGLATAAKKSGRTAAEGQVSAAVTPDAQTGVLVETNCETDFVAKGEAFSELVGQLTEQALSDGGDGLESLLNKPATAMPSVSVREFITEKIGQIKENMSLRRITHYCVNGTGSVAKYIHTGGKIGVLTEFAYTNAATKGHDAFAQLSKDVCMQIASFGAEFVSMAEIPQSIIDEETRVEMGKEDLQNKPEAIRENIVKGRVQKQLAAKVLVEQPFVKDPGQTIQAVLDAVSQQVNDTITVKRFTRYTLGDGIEKETTDFAAEVMAQLR
ncbi:MAG: translation elongation factor Ts [Vampirovibrionales bacterium]